MKTMRPTTLQLNLSRQNSLSESASGYITPVNSTMPASAFQLPKPGFAGAHYGSSESRSSSVSSMCSDVTVNNVDQPYMPYLMQCTSVSSLASSVGGGSSSPVTMMAYLFTPGFDDTLLQVYHSFANQANATPFNVNFPPSGVCSKVAKIMYRLMQQDRSIVIDCVQRKHDELMQGPNRALCLTVIRKRLLELCNGNADQAIPLARSDSPCMPIGFSQPLMPALMGSNSSLGRKPSWLHQNKGFAVGRIPSTDSLVDSVQMPVQQQPLPQPQTPLNFYGGSPHQHNNNGSNLQYFASELVTPPPSAFSQKTRSPSQQSLLGQTAQLASPLNAADDSEAADRFTFETYRPLDSPFHDNLSPLNVVRRRASLRASPTSSTSLSSPYGAEPTQSSPLFNATSQRKRDSLKMKRNMH